MATEKRRESWRSFYARKVAGMNEEELEEHRKRKAEYDAQYRVSRAARRMELRIAYREIQNAKNRSKTEARRALNPRKPPQTKEELLDKNRARRAANRERYNAMARDYYQRNSDRLREYALQKYESNPTAWIQRNNRRTAERRKTDPSFRATLNLLTRCSSFIQGKGKAAKWCDLFGCTAAEFRKHLASKWLPGMSWENYGSKGWHVDHIIPLSSFDMTDPEQQRKAFHYTNTQPLWAIDNIRKSDRTDYATLLS